MVFNENVKKVLYGGDYNPEQWDESVWQEDMRLLKLAGIDIVTLNVFSWAGLQPDEENYHFEQLDKIMKLVAENGLKVCLATSTAVPPAWMAKRYPDILRVDFQGRKRKFGIRHNACPNSPTYQKYSVRLAERISDRYKEQKNIVAWHISNEFGGECYCENCEKAFRVWLKEKYNTLTELNKAWNTAFWGHTFYDWDEIVLPNELSEHFDEERTVFQGISLDYRRFNSDSLLKCYRAEANAIRVATPQIPITTNLMGFYKTLDYKKWAGFMDFISWDNYPSNEEHYAQIAMKHDLNRGLKNGSPFVLMEQTPSVSNWLAYNALKRPGVMRLWSYQAVAHGADAVMFFQMRRSIGACEKFHGAVIDHVGHENTRVFREVAALGEELKIIGDQILGAVTTSEVAIIVDWDNWWALEYSAGPSQELRYLQEAEAYYRALHQAQISVDIIGSCDDFSKYKVVIAPLLYMVKAGVKEQLEAFTESGGTFITTYFSGIVDDHDLVETGGYPGRIRELMGIWVEECDALPKGMANSFCYRGTEYRAELICDIIHLESAVGLGSYEHDFYQGMPVLTRNDYGKGKAYYVGTRSEPEFYSEFLKEICSERNVCSVMKDVPPEVEVTKRVNEKGVYLFVLNHSDEEKEIKAENDCQDIINGINYTAGNMIKIVENDVKIFRLESV